MRSRSLQRSAILYRWTLSIIRLLCVLAAASVVILLFFLFDGGHSTSRLKHHIPFWRNGRSWRLSRTVDSLLEQMPLGSFLIDRQILSCLISTGDVYPEVCLGLLLEYDVLEFGYIHQPNTTYDIGSDSCLLQTSELQPCQPWKKECDKAGSAFISHILFHSQSYAKLLLVTIFYPVSQFHAKSSALTVPSKSVSETTACLDSEIRFWNRRAKRLTGLARKEVIPRKLRLRGYVTTFGLSSPLLLPERPATLFVDSSDAGQYIPCAVKAPPKDLGFSAEHQLFRSRARAILLRAQRILEKHGLRWWLSSGTCLGKILTMQPCFKE
ncbi:hypothetical protein RvY_17109-2 [Ramazzottius varieornatus]|uniref:Uncharacterized protein n=1 Tax=Ramazzottius varieornatus TaxID=947166 RepID=A0A1D1W503_RAMVA|nr:hypothetical protein RvY_17109-2 [Ramazzottius varieornatus]